MNTETINPPKTPKQHMKAFKPNPLLARMPAGDVTPGNWADSVWYAKDFSRIEFNGTRQLMRPPRRQVSFDDDGNMVEGKALGVYRATSPRYKTKDGSTFERNPQTGAIRRTSPRQFCGTRRVRGAPSV